MLTKQYSHTKFNSRDDINYSLERMYKALRILYDVHNKIPPVIHIAGTNGKGSTLAFLQSILENEGYTVHAYTSPHLLKLNERITVSSERITDEYLSHLLFYVQKKCSSLGLSYFELATLVAFLAFFENGADFTLLETGLGGKFDATNVIKESIASVITPISIDHVEFLGKTLNEITYHKAGIIKTNQKVIIGEQINRDVFSQLKNTVHVLNSKSYSYSLDWRFIVNKSSFRYMSKGNELSLPLPSMIGEHQIHNASLAIACREQILSKSINRHQLGKSISDAINPGRMQEIDINICRNNKPDNYKIFVDGAHNAAAAKEISKTLKDLKFEKYILVIGLLKDRDPKAFIEHFNGIVDKVCCVKIIDQKSWEANELRQYVDIPDSSAFVFNSVKESINFIRSTELEDTCVLFTGSLYLVGEVLSCIESNSVDNF
jgi:dihydrofolate synthase / folylpolyglutamate synthase